MEAGQIEYIGEENTRGIPGKAKSGEAEAGPCEIRSPPAGHFALRWKMGRVASRAEVVALRYGYWQTGKLLGPLRKTVFITGEEAA